MPDHAADLILENGRIYTMNPKQPWASAIAVKRGRIVAVGEDDQVRPFAGQTTETVDLGGKMLMPGIVDVHTHMMMGGQAELFELRFSPNASLEGVLDSVREAAAQAGKDDWIVGGQWSTGIISQLNTTQALAALDDACGGRPVVLRDDTYHNRWASSAAMRIAGIDADTPDPDQGSIGRDPDTGQPTGIMIESAAGLVERALANSNYYTPEMDRQAMAHAIGTLNSYGVTGFLDAATMQPALAALKGLDDRGELTAWASGAMPAHEPSFMFGIAGEELFEQSHQYRATHVRPNYVKIFLDGVPGARTAAFHDPYEPEPHDHGCCCFRGSTTVTVPDLIEWLFRAEELELAVKIHCTGDAAVSQALDAIEVVRNVNGPTKLLHHIAHASYIADKDMQRFTELNVVADLSPFLWFPSSVLEGHKQTMGEERATHFWPNKDLRATGALMAGGSDWPVMPNPDCWEGIEGLVTRQNPRGEFPGETLWPEQAVDVATALEIFTINSARAMGMDDIIGSLEVGKSADFILLDQNVLDVPGNEISNTKVLSTYFEGRVVYEG